MILKDDRTLQSYVIKVWRRIIQSIWFVVLLRLHQLPLRAPRFLLIIIFPVQQWILDQINPEDLALVTYYFLQLISICLLVVDYLRLYFLSWTKQYNWLRIRASWRCPSR